MATLAPESPSEARPRALPSWRTILVTLATAGTLLCWIVATPRNAGPDEPSHEIASAALVRGHLHGVQHTGLFPTEEFSVPAMVGTPDPGCYALNPFTPASCAPSVEDSTADAPRETTSGRYPLWGRVLPGLASFVPWPSAYVYLARLLAALLPGVLVVMALLRARRRSPGFAAAGLLGLTPIAWFSMSIVNPSGLAIGGGFAVWVALLVPRPARFDVLLVGGWFALLLPRRDGPVWATLLVAMVCLVTAQLPGDLWRRQTASARWALLVALPIPLLPTIVDGVRGFNGFLAVAPLALAAADLIGRNRGVRRWVGGHAVQAWIVVVIAAALGLAAVLRLRPGGTDFGLLQRILDATGDHLRQIVGVLGWLDAPVPAHATFLWWMVVGVLLAIALIAAPKLAGIGALALGATVLTAWVLELGTGDTSGTYWQGRYSMPFVVGIPLVLAAHHWSDRIAARRVSLVVGGGAWYVWNAAFVAAQQRWAVGTAGSLLPWDWNTVAVPIAPLVLIVAHAVASAALVWSLVSTADRLAEPR